MNTGAAATAKPRKVCIKHVVNVTFVLSQVPSSLVGQPEETRERFYQFITISTKAEVHVISAWQAKAYSWSAAYTVAICQLALQK